MGEIFTAGHSTHALETLLALLRRHGVRRVADVRAFPRSRRLPHFDREALAADLPGEGIDYVHLPELGGRRRPRPGSPNDGWRVEGFRAYADHMAGEEFAAALERLESLAAERPAAIMCAEGLWWRCHRRLIADALAVRGWSVRHIGPDGSPAEHELTPFARVEGPRLTYPAAQGRLGLAGDPVPGAGDGAPG